MKKELAQYNKKTVERQKKFESNELEKKIKQHIDAFIETGQIKSNIEQKRIRFQFDLEKRKQEIRDTLYSMQVWNCWDERVLDLVFKRPIGTSIDTVVRDFVSLQKTRLGSIEKSNGTQYEEQGY